MELRFNHSTEYDESTQPEGDLKKSAARVALSSITEFTGRHYPGTKRGRVAIRDIYVYIYIYAFTRY